MSAANKHAETTHQGQGCGNLRAPVWPLSIGAPVWACPAWSGLVYPAGTKRKDFLRWYSRMFNIVEGNSTFYGVPNQETFAEWASVSVEGFEFSFKFPRLISHEAMLTDCDREVREFLDRLRVLRDAGRLGPTFLQLGPQFGPQRFRTLARFIRRLPVDMPWAVEVRHPGWFDQAENQNGLDDLLRDHGVDKVIFDSRPLYQSPPDDAIEATSQTKKPKTPIHTTVTGTRPMLRLVGRNRIEKVQPALEAWCPILAKWIDEGLRPIVFTHAPDDAKAPLLAQRLLQTLHPHLPQIDLSLQRPPAPSSQLSLFE
ncbi:MAG: DUF72 domain-containing protein [Planctomycetota bacterium]